MSQVKVSLYRITAIDKSKDSIVAESQAHFSTAASEELVQREWVLVNAPVLTSVVPSNLLIKTVLRTTYTKEAE